jgi:hypothetical protein
VKHLPKFGTNRLNTFKYYNGTKKFDLNSIIGFALIFWYLVLSCTKTNRIQKWLQLKSSKRVTYRLKQQKKAIEAKIVEKQLLL